MDLFLKLLRKLGNCDVLQEKVTYVEKCNFAVEQKIAGNLKKVKFQVLMDSVLHTYKNHVH